MKPSALLMMCGILAIGSSLPAAAQDGDLFVRLKSDTNIKRFVFPKSMTVIQSCASQKFCLFDLPKSGNGSHEQWDKIFSNRERAKKILRKADPIRVVPVKTGDPVREPVTRDALKGLGKIYDTDFILVYRIKFMEGGNGPSFETQGLLYLTRQNKVLTLSSNLQGVDNAEGNLETCLNETYRAGLRRLAENTGKVIRAHKYEKLKSAY